MYILCIETSTTVCSVCIANEEKVISVREINSGYTHAENLNVFIEEILKEAGVSFKQLNAVAVSKGPGSYTGLRIGVSAAKGLCYALNISLISIDTLEAIACEVSAKTKEDMLYCPMLDARRMEVYCAGYDKSLKNILPVQALVLDENSINVFKLNKPLCFFGDGMPKAKELLQNKFSDAVFIENVIPSSKNMATLAFKKLTEKQFENTALFEPFYLKEFFIKKPD
ncbi:MAG TPA: tRNA (adenosine(37)-N6)-threonylcarbamoyltransferase complex dimerization subunit type 1 TsaB [Bacteroidia bacterium]|jgi:tRNA threonylcarbamoyladenosine biosynthesis protein TsaB|nr:tRNA (adenosine(37)-N6)-threonylcarbamoyltransferase complex dimerization subunit type 1 TsaB [Bacteroidia bacterium]